DLVRAAAPAHRGKDDPEQMRGPVEGGHLVAVAHDDREVIAGNEAHRAQPARDGFDLMVPFRIGEALASLDDGNRSGLPPHRNRKGATEIHSDLSYRPCRLWRSTRQD